MLALHRLSVAALVLSGACAACSGADHEEAAGVSVSTELGRIEVGAAARPIGTDEEPEVR